MHVEERIRRGLNELGLTDYEIKAYLALINRTEATATEISQVSNVPKSKIYTVMRSLCSKGWASEEGGRPTKYKPTHPAIAISLSKERIVSRIEEISREMTEELTPLYEARIEKEKPDLWIIRGEKEVVKSMREVVSRVKKQLSIAIPSLGKDMLNLLFPMATLLKERGGATQLLLGEVTDIQALRRLSLVAELRKRELTFGGGVICDSSEVILIIMTKGERKPNLAIYSAHGGLTNLARNYFDLLWATSEPITFD